MFFAPLIPAAVAAISTAAVEAFTLGATTAVLVHKKKKRS